MKKGIYVLLIKLPSAVIVQTRRKVFQMDAGYYAYVGSAMNGLEARIKRHLSTFKHKHWHVDYLLEYGTVIGVVSAAAEKRHECEVARGLPDLTPVPGFGCSDCCCRSHLYRGASQGALLASVKLACVQAGLPEQAIIYKLV
ncbi:MAG: GIY-YIG nuclease family protein [Dehalogenimonas sp.]|uniref:GIY-YIG nuclease family protein n=1 Tax=Candidatus Dehalogenimonas loeffleri TaxID=3127115 RepID=A0ABZ2J3G8_9CHLR|nr:GIY-YIG nuclease family protein [Dehalogenimonas sp.]